MIYIIYNFSSFFYYQFSNSSNVNNSFNTKIIDYHKKKNLILRNENITKLIR